MFARAFGSILPNNEVSTDNSESLASNLERQPDQAQSELVDVKRQLEESRDLVARYRSERNSLFDRMALLVEATSPRSRSQRTPYRNAEALAEALANQVESLLQQREEDHSIIRRLHDKLDARAPKREEFALDAFRDTADQVSEAHVAFSGRPSVESLNTAIDDLVLEVQEQVNQVVAAKGYSHGSFVVAQPKSDSPLVVSMAQRGLTEEHHGLLLDACLHARILHYLYGTFFSSAVTTVSMDETRVLDMLFDQVSKAGKNP